MAFDAATFEIWGALLNGAAVRRGGARRAARCGGVCAAPARIGRFTLLFLTTALFNRLAELDAGAFGGLDTLLFGGEAVDARRVAAVVAAGGPRRLLHVYGPTESTTFATWHEVSAADADARDDPDRRSDREHDGLCAGRAGAPAPGIGVAGEL